VSRVQADRSRSRASPAPRSDGRFSYGTAASEHELAEAFDAPTRHRRGQLFVFAHLYSELIRAVAEYRERVTRDVSEKLDTEYEYFGGEFVEQVQIARRQWRPMTVEARGAASVAVVVRSGLWPDETVIEAQFALDERGDLRVRSVGFPPGSPHLPEVIRRPSDLADARQIAVDLADRTVRTLARHNHPLAKAD